MGHFWKRGFVRTDSLDKIFLKMGSEWAEGVLHSNALSFHLSGLSHVFSLVSHF